jgi:hypothetical protein
VIINVVSVYVVKTSVNNVVIVIAVRHHFVSAVFIMLTVRLNRRAAVRVFIRDFNFTFIPVIFVFVMEMAVVDIVNMVAVVDFRVSAGKRMLVLMIVMCMMCHKRSPPFCLYSNFTIFFLSVLVFERVSIYSAALETAPLKLNTAIE